MRIELNPAKWFAAKPIATNRPPQSIEPTHYAVAQEDGTAKLIDVRTYQNADSPISIQDIPNKAPLAQAKETTVATAAVTPVIVQLSKNSFIRFIDKIGAAFKRAEPAAVQIAQEAEPILALTPFGPEYNVAVNAVVSAQQQAAASLAAGVNLTSAQKAQIAIAAATPALNVILTQKGVSTSTEMHIASWIQNVFNILAGPVAQIEKTVTQV